MIKSNVFYRISHTDIMILQKACKINVFFIKKQYFFLMFNPERKGEKRAIFRFASKK